MLKVLLSVLIAAVSLAAAAAEKYPSRPIRMVVGLPPGGPTDLAARLTGQKLTEALGQQVVIDNRPGAGGSIAGGIMAKAAPDGYTLFTAANGEIAIAPNLYRNLPYDPQRDLAPVSRVGMSQLMLVVHLALPADSVKELIALAKAKPGAINFASSGTGTTAHLSSELFKTMAGIDIVHVPYKGAGPALSELVGGQVQMLISGASTAIPHVKAGRLRALAVTGAKRLAALPEIPTIGETLPGYAVNSWYGVFAPRGTPRAIIAKLHSEIARFTRSAEVIERLTALGIEPEGNTPEEFARQVREETAKWGRIIKAAGVRLD